MTAATDPQTSAAELLTRAAVAYARGGDRPAPPDVVEAMLTLERASKRDRGSNTLSQLLGTWRLAFVTGTQKTRKRAGKAIGAGRYLPVFPTIHIAYQAADAAESSENPGLGRAVNCVAIGSLALTVTGPIEAIAGKRIMAFDFTRWSVGLGSWTAWRGAIGGGADSEAGFADRPLSKRPFFNYFWVSETAIAARGKGGGLAMWVRDDAAKSAIAATPTQ
ncbi:MAG: hypothetical protein ACFB9N_18840 [Geitlerinemataceae cyanobacterium]